MYRSGEVEVATVLVDASSRPPTPVFGPKFTRGPSRSTVKQQQRAIIACGRERRLRPLMLTLTSLHDRSDEDMRQRFASFLAWGRKYLPQHFEHRLWRSDPQQRGVLHFHVLLLVPSRIPAGLFRRMRRLWAEVYDMGPGSVDVQWMRSAKGAASYMARAAAYLGKQGGADGYRLGLDGEGMLSWEPWRKSRHNGQWYVRVEWRGRASDMSRALRAYAAVHVELAAEWGAFPMLGLNGRSWYFEDTATAERFLVALLSPLDTG